VNIPTLTTDRLVLRAFRESDVAALTALHSDPEVMRFLRPGGAPETRPRQAWEYVAMMTGHWLLKGYGKWALADRKTDELIGRVGYFDAPYEWPGLELGWTVSRHLWGQGYATEAAELALEWGFADCGMSDVISAIHPDNARSVKVARRLGESYRHETTITGNPCAIYGITKDEWRARYART
jgi:RimJ/RimL family protein N-acetyltransferase